MSGKIMLVLEKIAILKSPNVFISNKLYGVTRL